MEGLERDARLACGNETEYEAEEGQGVMANVVVYSAPTDQLFQISCQVIPAVVVFYLGRPVVFARADEHLLRVVGYQAVEVRLAVDCEAFRQLRSGRALTCR